MSQKELTKLNQEKFEITELDDAALDDVAGGADVNQCTNGSQCQCPPKQIEAA